MKKTFSKLFMLLGVLLFLGAGNANAVTLHVVGNNVNGISWDPNQNAMTEVKTNVFVWEGNTLGNEFKVVENWNDNEYNRGNYNNSSLTLGNAYKTGKNTGNISINGGTVTKPRVVYNHNKQEVTVISTSGAEGWNIVWDNGGYSWETKALTKESDNIWSTTITPKKATGNFGIEKMAGNYQYDWYQGNKSITSTNTSAILEVNYNDTNPSFSFNVGSNYKVSWNSSTKEVSIVEESTVPDLYVISGVGSSWTLTSGTQLTYNSTNKNYTGNITVDENTYILFTTKYSSSNSDWDNLASNGYCAGSDVKVTLTNNETYNGNIQTGKDGAFQLINKGTYSVTVSLTNNSVSFKAVNVTENKDYSSWWVNLRGDFNDWNGGGQQLTEDNPVATFENVEFSKRDKQGNAFKVMVYNGNGDTWYTADATIATGDWVQFENKEGQDNNTYVEGDNIYKTYTVEYNAETNQIKITPNEPNYPKNIYIYGNVNDWYWDVKVGVMMKPVEGQPGVYKAEDVEFSGQWDENAANMLPEEQRDTRPVGGSTGNENYVAFYEDVPNDFNGYKFGSNSTDNNIVINLNGGESQSSSVYFVTGNYANFQVYKGLYDVTFDLNTMTATWEKPQIKDSEENPVKEHVFNWWSGCNQKFEGMTANNAELIEDLTDDADNVHSDYDGYAFRTFEYGDDLNNVIQAGVDDNPMHLLAKQVNYTVFYRAPSDRPAAQKQQVKRLAGESSTNSAITSVDQLTPGFVEAVEGTHYTMFGSSDYKDNCVLQLDLAGDYVVTADVKDDYDDNGINYAPIATSLFVTVQQASLKITTGDDISVAFNPADDNEFEEMISLSADLEYGKDFTLEFEPVNVEEWAVPSDPEDLEASYRKVVTDAIYQLENIGFDSKIDGFYTGVTDINAVQTGNTGGYYTYKVTANVPCSGKYTVKVVPSDNYQVEEDATASIEVYPNLQGIFGGKVHGFLINDYTFGEGSEGTIAFDDNFTDEMRAACFGEYPGTYFIDAISSTTPVADAAFYGAKRMAKVTDYLLPMNLTDQSSTEITVVKNGATGTHKFEITTSEEAITGVDSVEAVDGEAVYFNLQGQKVDNPDKGIYIKVSGGKASKVIL